MASREVVPRTWPQGLNAAERIKAEMERAALDNPENPEEEVFDDLLWRQNVTDLHRVMEVAKSLWLLLEHSNEAMVRVALEIALDGTYKKVLWWPDFWFSDHEKREYFKEIVRIKLAIAIANAKGSAVDFSEFEKNDEESELVAKLRKQIAELEAALRDARLEKEAAEARIRELELAAKEAEEKLAAMEKSLEQLRREVKEFRRQSDNQGPSASLEELERVKQQLKQSEEKNAQLEEMISQLRKQLQEGNKSGEVEKIKSELQMAKKRIEELEQKLMDAQKEIAMLKRQKGGAPGPPTPVATDDSAAIRRLKEELEEERRRRLELEELLKKTEAEMDQLKKDIDAERKKSLDLSNQLKNLPKTDNKKETVTEIKEVTVPGGLSEEQLRELEELRAKAEELEKLKAKLKKRDQQIASLQEDNDKLNEEQVRLLKLLKQVKEQLRILMELAEKKGLGDVIKKLFEEAGLGKTMADPDYTCFDRLYDDALRRMDKQRRMEWYRLGNTGEPPPSFKAKHAYRRRESPERLDGKQGRAATSVYCRNCVASVEVPNTSSQPASRSPSPFERYDSAASTYYQAGNTYLQQSFSSTSLGSNRSLSPGGPHSRSISPSPGGAMDLRIQSIRPANGGHIALSVATWGDSNPSNPSCPPGGFQPAQTFHNMSTHMTHQLSRKTRSRSPEMRSRPSERNLPPLRDASNPQHRMMGSSSATELRRDHGHCGQVKGAPPGAGPAMFVAGMGPGKMRGAMFVQEPRPFRAAEFTGEDPRMMWRPQKSLPLNPPGLRD